jgi:hypothetical protein
MLWYVSYWPGKDAGYGGRVANQIGRFAPRAEIAQSSPERPRLETRDRIRKAELMLILVDPEFAAKLSAPDDPLRFEIATALACRIRIVPVLVRRASPPAPEDLPSELASLAMANAQEIRHGSFQEDLRQLVQKLLRPEGDSHWTEPAARGKIRIGSPKAGIVRAYLQTENTPAQVLIDGMPRGVLKLTGDAIEVDVICGEHTVTLQSTGKWPVHAAEVKLQIAAGQTARVLVSRDWLAGTLSVVLGADET